MSELQIREVDRDSDDDLVAWREVCARAEEAIVGDHSVMWSVPELKVVWREPRKHRRDLFFVGELDGRVVAAGAVGLPVLDNLNAAELGVSILPEVQRRGLGSQLLAHVESVAVQHDRSRFDAMAAWPYDAPADGSGSPGVEFGRVHDYSCGLGEVQRELPLPVDEALLEELAAEAAPYHQDYEIRSWAGPVPDDLIQGWLDLSATLITEAPTGDNEYEEENTDIEAARIQEAVLEKQGRVKFNTAALDKDGTVVAYTDLVLPGTDQRWVFQWGTLVHRDHRGHRLGMAVKCANLLGLLRSGNDLTGRRIVTWNAGVNDHMIGINERMGFRPTARGGELQKKIG